MRLRLRMRRGEMGGAEEEGERALERRATTAECRGVESWDCREVEGGGLCGVWWSWFGLVWFWYWLWWRRTTILVSTIAESCTIADHSATRHCWDRVSVCAAREGWCLCWDRGVEEYVRAARRAMHSTVVVDSNRADTNKRMKHTDRSKRQEEAGAKRQEAGLVCRWDQRG